MGGCELCSLQRVSELRSLEQGSELRSLQQGRDRDGGQS